MNATDPVRLKRVDLVFESVKDMLAMGISRGTIDYFTSGCEFRPTIGGIFKRLGLKGNVSVTTVNPDAKNGLPRRVNIYVDENGKAWYAMDILLKDKDGNWIVVGRQYWDSRGALANDLKAQAAMIGAAKHVVTSATFGLMMGGPGQGVPARAPLRLPPADVPKPPGWNKSWTWEPSTRLGESRWRWWDPQGGEWRWHPADRWHLRGHWDYNPWTEWNSSWQNIPAPGPGGS